VCFEYPLDAWKLKYRSDAITMGTDGKVFLVRLLFVRLIVSPRNAVLVRITIKNAILMLLTGCSSLPSRDLIADSIEAVSGFQTKTQVPANLRLHWQVTLVRSYILWS